MPEYRKKPVVIGAVQFFATRTYTPEDGSDIIFDAVKFGKDGTYYIETLEGHMQVNEGDWIIKGIAGEFYPCKPDIFDLTYEEV